MFVFSWLKFWTVFVKGEVQRIAKETGFQWFCSLCTVKLENGSFGIKNVQI